MGLGDVTAESVRQAIQEYERLGVTDFLSTYGFGRARRLVLVHDGRIYDSKAIVGVAHGYATGTFWRANDLSGGLASVIRTLRRLGFETLDQGEGVTFDAPDDALKKVVGDALVPDGTAKPGQRVSTAERVVRATAVSQFVKRIHDHTCQVCRTRLAVHGHGYSEGAHIRPLGGGHGGPDVPSNVLCLCPNCHVLFDIGALIVDDAMQVWVDGEPRGQLTVDGRHVISAEHLAYHREYYERLWAGGAGQVS
jgi:hypothetical protein